MQAAATQEQMDRVIPTWCMENGFGEDSVTVFTFTELAHKLLSLPTSNRSPEACMPTFALDSRLDDRLLEEAVSNDSIPQGALRPGSSRIDL